jgi:hypothetical protein
LKLFLSFIGGMAVCGLLIFTVRMVLPVQAATNELGGASENETNSLARLLPDIEKIYRDSLTMPFKMAEKKIYDEDVAAFYRALMDKTGLVPSESK